MSKDNIILIGAGGHCRSCIDVIERDGRYKVAGIVENDNAKKNFNVLGHPVIGTDNDLQKFRKIYSNALITIGQIQSPNIRIKLHHKLIELGFALPVIISPLAYVSKYAKIGQGTIVMHHALINAGAVVGENCIINSKALVEHDVVINSHCHISTGAILNGLVHIGNGSFVGSNSTIKEGVKLSDECLVGMGLSVRTNQPKGSWVLS